MFKYCDINNIYVIVLIFIKLKSYLLSFLMTIIVFLYLITEVVNLHNLNNVNHVNNLENSSMENLHLDCLDQLILVVHLPDVSVTNTK